MVPIGTDWFVMVDCPRPGKNINNRDEHIKACAGCLYAIWKEPQPVAGFMMSMCGVRVGSIGMAAELDDIAETLLGVERFTEFEGHVLFKLGALQQIRSHAKHTSWKLKGFTLEETLEHMDSLIEFCKRAEAKDLTID